MGEVAPGPGPQGQCWLGGQGRGPLSLTFPVWRAEVHRWAAGD